MSANPNSQNSVKDLYEGDQSKLYSGVMSHHYGQSTNSNESKGQISRIWKVTGILTVITIVEVVMGLLSSKMGVPKGVINSFFLILTLLKAAYIVRVFMHLGDEVRNFIVTMLIPLTLFVWFIIAFLADGNFWLSMNKNQAAGMQQQHKAQQEQRIINEHDN